MINVLNKRNKGVIQDSIEYILNADRREFNKILKALKDPNGKLDFVYEEEINNPDITKELFTVGALLLEIENMKNDFRKKGQKSRIDKLEKCRTEDVFKKQIQKDFNLSKKDVKELFEVLSGEKEFEEFVQEKRIEERRKKNFLPFFKAKTREMLPQSEMQIANHYLNLIKEIDEQGYCLQYPMLNKQENKERFSFLKHKNRVEKEIENYGIVLGKNDEANWEISDELKEYVYEDMPENLRAEEKAVWTYLKLCKTLHYDDSKMYEKKDNSLNISFLEKVKPDYRVICFDFARIYGKFVNEIEGNEIEAKVVGSDGHFLVKLISKDIVATAEATNAISGSNEMYKVKIGLPIEGMRADYDPKEIISGAIERFTPLIYKDTKAMDEYLEMLDKIRKDERQTEKDIPSQENELSSKLEALIQTFKGRNIDGIEAVTGMLKFSKIGFIDDNVEMSIIKEKVENNGKTRYRNCVCVCKEGQDNAFHIIDTENMTIEELEMTTLVERFNTEQYSYRDEEHPIQAIKDKIKKGTSLTREEIRE